MGNVASVYAMKSTSLLGLQLQGLVACSLLYLVITLCSSFMVITGVCIFLLVMYALTYFAMGYGPTPATYLVPSIVFPAKCTNTANGLCATFGKVGAVLFVFFSMDYDIDITGLMAFLGVFSILGGASTLVEILSYRKAITDAQARHRAHNGFNQNSTRETTASGSRKYEF